MDKALQYVSLKPTAAEKDHFSAQSPKPRQEVCGFLTPPEIFQACVLQGVQKSKLSWWKTLWLGVLAGIYLSFGGALLYFAGGQAPALQTSDPGLVNLIKGFFGLPFGLALILICGAELVTGNFAFMPAAFFEGRITFMDLFKNWWWSFWGNLAGSLFMVWMVDEAHLLAHGPTGAITNKVPVSTAMQKVSKGWGHTVAAAFCCNYLVCLGAWQATAAQDICGKILGILFPIGAFVTIGFEHLVANMFLIPFAMKVGAPVTVGRYIGSSMLPVLIGNIISACFFLSGSYSFCYGTLAARISNCMYSLAGGKKPERAYSSDDDTAHGRPASRSDKQNGTIHTPGTNIV